MAQSDTLRPSIDAVRKVYSITSFAARRRGVALDLSAALYFGRKLALSAHSLQVLRSKAAPLAWLTHPRPMRRLHVRRTF